MTKRNRSPVQLVRLPRLQLWPVRAISLLLLVEAGALFLSSLYLFSRIDWAREWNNVALSGVAFETVSFCIFFVPLAVVAIFSAVGFLFFWRVAWLTAMIVQGVSLFGCLAIYFESYLKDYNFVYLIMLYSIVMVLYLNNNDIRVMFQAKPSLQTIKPDFENDSETPEMDNTDKIGHEQPEY